MKYIDIHSHLNLNQFDTDRERVIEKLKSEDIATITVGVDLETSKFAVQLAEMHYNLFACVGLHPADNETEVFDYDKYLELAKNEKVVAIGECGLDYFRLPEGVNEIEEIKNKQKDIFKKHIGLAIELGKPLMIHARPSKGSMDAYADALDILDLHKKENPSLLVNFHFFVGDTDIAKRIIGNNWSMSFDGPITFARDYDEVIRLIPLHLIMAETDAPFASPAPHRGKRCEPWMVGEVVKKIAEIKNLPQEEVEKALLENAKRVFDI
mgnify:CR=1 FL=1